MRPEERHAAQILQKLYEGSVESTDTEDAPDGTHDLTVRTATGFTIAVEVTQETSPDALSQRAAIEGVFWNTDEVDGMWYVAVTGNARVKGLKPEVISLIKEGLVTQDHPLERGQSLEPSAIQQRLDRLGIVYIKWIDNCAPGRILVDRQGHIGSFAASDLTDLVEHHAGLLDNVTKLERAVADERHLWIWVTVEPTEAFAATIDGPTPTSLPNVPSAIDTVWVVPYVCSQDEPLRSWRWSRRDGWHRLDNFPPASE